MPVVGTEGYGGQVITHPKKTSPSHWQLETPVRSSSRPSAPLSPSRTGAHQLQKSRHEQAQGLLPRALLGGLHSACPWGVSSPVLLTHWDREAPGNMFYLQ
jgi:hypothetical protein